MKKIKYRAVCMRCSTVYGTVLKQELYYSYLNPFWAISSSQGAELIDWAQHPGNNFLKVIGRGPDCFWPLTVTDFTGIARSMPFYINFANLLKGTNTFGVASINYQSHYETCVQRRSCFATSLGELQLKWKFRGDFNQHRTTPLSGQSDLVRRSL